METSTFDSGWTVDHGKLTKVKDGGVQVQAAASTCTLHGPNPVPGRTIAGFEFKASARVRQGNADATHASIEVHEHTDVVGEHASSSGSRGIGLTKENKDTNVTHKCVGNGNYLEVRVVFESKNGKGSFLLDHIEFSEFPVIGPPPEVGEGRIPAPTLTPEGTPLGGTTSQTFRN